MILQTRFINAYFNENLGGGKNNSQDSNVNDVFFKIGNQYIIQGEECDNFSMPSRLYQLVAECKILNGINVDAVIMKQISGEKNSMVFSLTKTDCKTLGINFEKGLQVFSKNLAWKPIVKEEIKKDKNKFFDDCDLSTYPVDKESGKIKRICVKIGGFIPTQKYDITFGDYMLKHMEITTNFNIKNNAKYRYRIITEVVTNGKYTTIDNNGSIYVEIDLESVFGIGGLEPNKLGGLNINDIISVKFK